MFKLEVLRARNGDCLLIHFGDASAPRLVLIDGGPSHVYPSFLKPTLDAIREDRGLSHTDEMPIDLLMVSHVDDDHINGVLQLTDDLMEARDQGRPQFVRVETLWHNSFNDIIGDTPDELTAAIAAQFGAAAAGGQPPNDPNIGHDAAMILASVRQGRNLRNVADALDWEINAPFDRLILADPDAPARCDLDEGLTLHIVGPMKPEVEALQKKHDKFLRDNHLGRASPEAALAAFSDRSVANLASIVVLAEKDGRRILLTGDARGDKVLDGLKLQGLMPQSGPLHVDVLKVMHHGSDRNVTRGFFEDVQSDHYVFCGDGKHGNPDRSTLEMLFKARRQGGFTLHFSYGIDQIDRKRKDDHHGHWRPPVHALADFLEQKRDDGVPFDIQTPDSGDLSISVEL